MGLCASADASDDQQTTKDTTQKDGQTTKGENKNGANYQANDKSSNSQQTTQTNGSTGSTHSKNGTPASSSSSASLSDDTEYRAQMRYIFLNLIDRLVQVMEHEREGSSILAKLRNGSNASYLALFGSGAIQEYLRTNYDSSIHIVSPKSSAVDREAAFASMLAELQQKSDYAQMDAKISRAEFTKNIKVICNTIQEEIKISLSALDSSVSDFVHRTLIKKELVFFYKMFKFVDGDLVAEPNLLEKNCEDIIKQTPE